MTDERQPAERNNKYPLIIQAIAHSPWEITHEALAMICQIVRFRAEGGLLSEDEIGERVASRASRRDPYTTASSGGGAVAVLPLYGVIAPKVNLMTEYSGGTALSEFRTSFQQALADPAIGAILIDVDSPGGSTALVAETAAEIRAARGVKPIVAIANTLCASAAYHLACQADELVGTPSALIGSVGVYMVHDNLEEMLAMAGIDRTLISAGPFKVDGNPWQPLTETARTAAQSIVDETYDRFVTDIAAGRGVNEDAVRNGYGQGRVLTATQAAAEGMADRVASFDETVAGLMEPTRPAGRQSSAEDVALELDGEAIAERASRLAAQRAADAPKPSHENELGELAELLRQTSETVTEETETK